MQMKKINTWNEIMAQYIRKKKINIALHHCCVRATLTLVLVTGT